MLDRLGENGKNKPIYAATNNTDIRSNRPFVPTPSNDSPTSFMRGPTVAQAQHDKALHDKEASANRSLSASRKEEQWGSILQKVNTPRGGARAGTAEQEQPREHRLNSAPTPTASNITQSQQAALLDDEEVEDEVRCTCKTLSFRSLSVDVQSMRF